MSALVRMAAGEHRTIKLKRGDTVMVSSSPIPGNEKAIADVIDNLFRLGVNVIYGKDLDVHASGHGSQEDMKMMITLTRPKYFIPFHGDFRFLVLHARLAQAIGIPRDHCFVVDNGRVIQFSSSQKDPKLDDVVAMLLRDRIQAGYVLVDGLGVGDVGNIVLRDRQAMAKDGIFVCIMTVESKSGKLITSPDIISRGFIYMRESEELVHKTRAKIRELMAQYNEKHRGDMTLIKQKIRDDVGQFLYDHTQRRPMVIPVVIEV